MATEGAGKRRLVAAAIAGVVLVGILVAIQLIDDGDGDARNSSANPSTRVEVKGTEVTRLATLTGTVTGAEGAHVEVTVLDTLGTKDTTADAKGRYRVTGIAAGPIVLTWIASDEDSAGGGVSLSSERTGRTQITLDPGSNTYDIAL
jgi:hypothetical protein